MKEKRRQKKYKKRMAMVKQYNDEQSKLGAKYSKVGKSSHRKHKKGEKSWHNEDLNLQEIIEEESNIESSDKTLDEEKRIQQFEKTKMRMQYQFIDNAVIGKCSWERVRKLVNMKNFYESSWYSKLSEADLKKLEMCIQV